VSASSLTTNEIILVELKQESHTHISSHFPRGTLAEDLAQLIENFASRERGFVPHQMNFARGFRLLASQWYCYNDLHRAELVGVVEAVVLPDNDLQVEGGDG
jgi:hypothetical protein